MNTYFIDVREPFEFNLGHVKDAINVPSASLMQGAPELRELPKNATLVVYCRTGSRSALAINVLKNLGFENLINGINKEQVNAKYNLQ
jgi:rhodanese-related sulfurtransferase